MAFIQETKSQQMDDVMVSALWGSNDVEWTAKGSEGASGGMLIIWRKGDVEPLFSFRTEGALGVCANFKGQAFFFINVYSSCQIEKKKACWSDLVKLKNKFGHGWWGIDGDFKTVRDKKEKVGRRGVNRILETTEFNDFIEQMDLVDLPTIGSRFTWSNKEGSARSRLDRFLLSESLIDSWKIANDTNWGPKPVRVNSCWFENKDFKKFVEEAWTTIEVQGNQAYVMKEKFKALRNKLKVCNIECFGWVDVKVEEAVANLNECDRIVTEGESEDG
ncbi:uncharacterized protein LOC131604619 [Vicia villosa]|uniref:uncharacterized protein LOC131604619 n=1 Tax=Vicia villosa TaxID=3911 RepID=UPI00273B1306|nr:uncharacterized protein LOC131604619 [Vicia villosa]